MKVFKQFTALRFADDTVYLRSGSLNLVNGFIGLNFSCDGTHYLTFDDFLSRGLNFWFGEGVSTESDPEKCLLEEKIIDVSQLDEILEEIAQSGCLEVNQIIRQLDSGTIPKRLNLLKDSERDYIHSELKSIMSVYNGSICSI